MQSVQIACNGEWHDLGGKFTSVSMPAFSPVFISPDFSQISGHVGQPMFLHQMPTRPALEQRHNYLDNQQATFMMLETRPNHPGFGWAPPKYQNRVGSILVTRQDRSPLQPMDVESSAWPACSLSLKNTWSPQTPILAESWQL